MSVIPTDTAHVTLMLQNDAQQFRTFLNWVNDRYNAYNQNLNTGVQMTAAGISASGVPSDQDRVTALKGALNNIRLLSSNQAATQSDMGFAIRDILGIL
jgi:Tfp pilus assembly protein PilN